MSSSPDRLLGFVLLFTDLTERYAADTARRRFQQDLIQSRRVAAGPPNSNATLLLQTILAAAVENAQLAGLEITEGLDVARVPELLDSV